LGIEIKKRDSSQYFFWRGEHEYPDYITSFSYVFEN